MMVTQKLLQTLFTLSLILAQFEFVHAADTLQFGDYTVDYTTFPSTALQAEITAAYGIKRSQYETLVNVFVSKQGKQGGVEVAITGTASNLMAQQQRLTFLEIKEDNTVYYIAAVRVTNEETTHFNLTIQPLDSAEEFAIKFTKTLYKD